MLKYTGRIGCSALTDLVLKCFSIHLSQVFDHSVTLYIDISLTINGSFIVARAFYAHVFVSSSGQNVYENIREQQIHRLVCANGSLSE